MDISFYHFLAVYIVQHTQIGLMSYWNICILFAWVLNDLHLLPRLWDKGFTPVCTEKLIGLLKVYSKRDDAEILKNGFLNGFRLNYIGPVYI